VEPSDTQRYNALYQEWKSLLEEKIK
jgi:hypothetical protein